MAPSLRALLFKMLDESNGFGVFAILLECIVMSVMVIACISLFKRWKRNADSVPSARQASASSQSERRESSELFSRQRYNNQRRAQQPSSQKIQGELRERQPQSRNVKGEGVRLQEGAAATFGGRYICLSSDDARSFTNALADADLLKACRVLLSNTDAVDPSACADWMRAWLHPKKVMPRSVGPVHAAQLVQRVLSKREEIARSLQISPKSSAGVLHTLVQYVARETDVTSGIARDIAEVLKLLLSQWKNEGGQEAALQLLQCLARIPSGAVERQIEVLNTLCERPVPKDCAILLRMLTATAKEMSQTVAFRSALARHATAVAIVISKMEYPSAEDLSAVSTAKSVGLFSVSAGGEMLGASPQDVRGGAEELRESRRRSSGQKSQCYDPVRSGKAPLLLHHSAGCHSRNESDTPSCISPPPGMVISPDTLSDSAYTGVARPSSQSDFWRDARTLPPPHTFLMSPPTAVWDVSHNAIRQHVPHTGGSAFRSDVSDWTPDFQCPLGPNVTQNHSPLPPSSDQNWREVLSPPPLSHTATASTVGSPGDSADWRNIARRAPPESIGKRPFHSSTSFPSKQSIFTGEGAAITRQSTPPFRRNDSFATPDSPPFITKSNFVNAIRALSKRPSSSGGTQRPSLSGTRQTVPRFRSGSGPGPLGTVAKSPAISDEVLRVYDSMLEAGFPPDADVLETIVRTLGRHRQVGKAFHIVRGARDQHNVRITPGVYFALAEAMIRNRSLLKALQLHDDMITQNTLPPHPEFLKTLLRSCIAGKYFERGVDIARAATGLPPPATHVTAWEDEKKAGDSETSQQKSAGTGGDGDKENNQQLYSPATTACLTASPAVSNSSAPGRVKQPFGFKPLLRVPSGKEYASVEDIAEFEAALLEVGRTDLANLLPQVCRGS